MYSSQWQIVDYKRLKAGNQTIHNLVLIVEEVPGSIISIDYTKRLLEVKSLNYLEVIKILRIPTDYNEFYRITMNS